MPAISFGNTALSVWWLDLRRLRIEPEALANRALADGERHRWARFVQDDDKLRFAAGRGLVRAILARQLACRPEAVEIGIGQNGRPHLVDRPDGPWFNLSHSGSVIALAVAPFPCVGIDTEEERSGVATELSARVCAASEQAALARLKGPRRIQHFFALWTLKEAYMKATGEGIGIDPQRCEFDLDEPPVARRLPDADDTAWSFRLWRITERHSLALAFRPAPGQTAAVDAPRHAEAIVDQTFLWSG